MMREASWSYHLAPTIVFVSSITAGFLARKIRKLKVKVREPVNLEMDRPDFGGRKPRGEGLATKKKKGLRD